MNAYEIVNELEKQGLVFEYSGGKIKNYQRKGSSPNTKEVERLTLEAQGCMKEIAEYLQTRQTFNLVFGDFSKEPDSAVVKKNYARFCIANHFPFYAYVENDDWLTNLGEDGWIEWAKLNEEVKVEDW